MGIGSIKRRATKEQNETVIQRPIILHLERADLEWLICAWNYGFPRQH